MAEYTARLASTDDQRNLVEWTHANRDRNHYDPEVFSYASSRVMAVDKDRSPVLYLPFQATVMTEGLSPKPARTKREIAKSLQTAIHEIARLAKSSGMGEIYFLASPDDTETIEFAKEHGYEALNLIPMRLKLRNMKPELPEEKVSA